MIKLSKEASSCLLLFLINKTEPGQKGPSAGFGMVSVWSLKKQRQASGLQLSSGGRRRGPEKEERSDWRTHGETAEEMDGEGGTAGFFSKATIH